MGVEIKQGFDSTIDDAANITGSATGFASRVVEVIEGLKSTNNELGSAAKANAVQTATAGDVPELGSNGKIAVAQLPTAIAGGTGSAGLIPILSSTGLIAASMIPSGSGGGGGSSGVKGIWFYTNVDQSGNAGTYNATTRQWTYTWRPQDSNGTYAGCTTALIIATGGGGSGAHGPAATVSNGAPGGGSVAGHSARKGGGGGAGSTVITMRTGVGSATTLTIVVGAGGDAMQSTGATTANNGASSQVTEIPITAAGGDYGSPLGNGGGSSNSGVGNVNLGFEIRGGMGSDGSFDRLGSGAGGASLWGGGFNGGTGRGGSEIAAHGGGGGAASGSTGVSPFTFTADRPGFGGMHGCVAIIGF